MYTDFYGLTSRPFQLNPDHSFYFSSAQHRRAKAYLEYGVQRNEGFIVITGEVGAGKTTIVRGLLASLDASKVVAANLVTTQLGAEDTLRMVASAFGVRVNGHSKADLLTGLEAFLLMQISQGKRCLLVVDEAQNLTHQVVEELRMLSNFQLNQQALLQTFLVGQPEFRAILARPDMQQLRQRVTATCHIGPLSLDDTRGYILHRLKCAGASDRPTYNAEAYQAIYEASGGIPRRINMICDRLLLLGFLEEKSAFAAEEVSNVVLEIHYESAFSHSDDSIATAPAGATESGSAAGSTQWADIDLSKLALTPALSTPLLGRIDTLNTGQFDARLRRLEDSMLRLEQNHVEILQWLQGLVSALRAPGPSES